MPLQFWVSFFFNTILITSLLGGVLEYSHKFSKWRLWLMSVFASITSINQFALYMPTPFTPWCFTVAKIVLTLLLLDIFGCHFCDLGVRYLKNKLERSGEPAVGNGSSLDDQHQFPERLGSFRQLLEQGRKFAQFYAGSARHERVLHNQPSSSDVPQPRGEAD